MRADLESPKPEIPRTEQSFRRRWVTPITASAVLLALTTGFIWIIDAPLQHDHLIFVYLIPTALIAIRYGNISAMCVAIASTFAAAFFLYAPRFSFMVASPLDLLELIFFSLLALLASQVVSGFAKDSDVERRRERAGVPPLRAKWPWIAGLWKRRGR
jgi:two-component system, OmpR family, sensor histidine kinase KdpD